MDTQDITIAMSRDILLKARLLAVKIQTSISGLLTLTFGELVQQDEEAYTHAQQRHLRWLDHAADLGTDGFLTEERGTLHAQA
jgi:HSP90 family molecular chaperone